MNNITTAGSLSLIFTDEKGGANNAGALDKYSIDFRGLNIGIAYDEVKDIPCVSVFDRKKNIMRYYNVEDGCLILKEEEEL